MWHSGEDGYVPCGIVGRMGMYHVAYWGGRVCTVWHTGEDGYVSYVPAVCYDSRNMKC